MRSVRDIPILEDIPVLARVTLNAPVENGKVQDTFRLKKALPTIAYLMQRRARVILASHITGESHKAGVGTETLRPMWEAMQEYIPGIQFCPVSTGPEARDAVRKLQGGEVLMLENLRRDPGEMKNDRAFAAKLAELADVFVQDSFDNCHREHASMVGVPELLPSYAGLLVEEEVSELGKALHPKSPSVAIIGGAKFATKEAVLKRLLAVYDRVYVGGALGNDFAKLRGYEVGRSLVSNAATTELAALLDNPKLMLSTDVCVAGSDMRPEAARVAAVTDVHADESILDDGPASTASIATLASKAKSILWNGPLGNYERGFTEGTEAVARAVAASSAHSVIGGGDTIAAVEKLGLNSRFSFISTGGGAMLDFLAKGTLPGLRALDTRNQ